MESAIVPLLAQFPQWEFRTLGARGIEDSISKSQEIEEMVEGVSSQYQTINVAKAMKDLTKVGCLFQVIYAGSNGYPSSSKVGAIMLGYQELLKDSIDASADFVLGSINALWNYRRAFNAIHANNLKDAISIISRCSIIAEKMERKSEKLVEDSTKLCRVAQDAFVNVMADKNTYAEKKRELSVTIAKHQSEEASLKTRAKGLAEDFEVAKEEEKKASKLREEAEAQAKKLSIFSRALSLARPVVSILAKNLGVNSKLGTIAKDLELLSKEREREQEECSKSQMELVDKRTQLRQTPESELNTRNMIERDIAKLEVKLEYKRERLKGKADAIEKLNGEYSHNANLERKNEENAITLRRDLTKKQREVDAELAKSVTLIEKLKDNNKDLTAAVASLDVAIKALGQITTIFQNTRLFWNGVSRQCKALSDIEPIVSAVDTHAKEELIEELSFSGFNWLGLFRINLSANKSLEQVNGFFDRVMNNLPSEQESKELIKRASIMFNRLITDDSQA